MKRILLYSPDVVGHPRVYCRVIADALATEPCQLVVAMGFTDEIGLNESPDIQPLSSRAGVQLIDTRTFSRTGKPHLTAEELVELQLRFDIDTTLFIEADKSKAEFFRIAAGEAPRFRGRNLGIFANTAEWYPGKILLLASNELCWHRQFRTTLGNIKRAIFEQAAVCAPFLRKDHYSVRGAGRNSCKRRKAGRLARSASTLDAGNISSYLRSGVPWRSR